MPIYIYLCCSLFCMFNSTMYHIFNCVDEETDLRFKTFDLVGISVLICGSYYPLVLYGFHCDTKIQLLYLVPVTFLSILSLCLTLSSYGLSVAGDILRTITYAVIGVIAFVPITHLLINYGFDSENFQFVAIKTLLGGFAFLMGALAYVFHFPERFSPGTFDYFGASHQILHILDVVGILIFYNNSVNMYNWLSNVEGVMC